MLSSFLLTHANAETTTSELVCVYALVLLQLIFHTYKHTDLQHGVKKRREKPPPLDGYTIGTQKKKQYEGIIMIVRERTEREKHTNTRKQQQKKG